MMIQDEESFPLYDKSSYQAARAKHARRMLILGIIQVVLVLALICVRIYNACCR